MSAHAIFNMAKVAVPAAVIVVIVIIIITLVHVVTNECASGDCQRRFMTTHCTHFLPWRQQVFVNGQKF
jgi:hypothetical protein